MTERYDPTRDNDVDVAQLESGKMRVVAHHNVIVTATYEHGAIPSREFAKAVSGVISREKRDPVHVFAYTSHYWLAPDELTLKDVWGTLTSEEINALPVQLRAAIMNLMFGQQKGVNHDGK